MIGTRPPVSVRRPMSVCPLCEREWAEDRVRRGHLHLTLRQIKVMMMERVGMVVVIVEFVQSFADGPD